MTLTQIECFEAVCESMSFSKAAGTLYVSQPAISKSISRLEEELGHALFERENNRLVLTAAGELFRDYVIRARQQYQALQEQLEDLGAASARTVRLGCPETWNPTFFTARLQACFARAVPEGRLSIEAHKLSDLLLRLQSGKLDFVFSHDFYAPSIPGLRWETLAETGMGILYSREAFPAPVTLKALAEKGFLVFDDDIQKRFGTVINGLCSRHGCETKIRSCGTVTRCLFELSRGTGVMLFTEWDSFVSNSAFGYFPVDDTLPVRLIYYPERLNAAGKAFIRELKKK
ncbi:MAG: LysR family transcriptional regulator [Oscillospiraceae bacterium]|nr:LysR family transcriptional regulator [Oscillospiraceae bacterium]